MSNLKQIGLGMLQYNQDYDELMPTVLYSNMFNFAAITSGGPPYANYNSSNTGSPQTYGASSFLGQVIPYVKSTGVFSCPDAAAWVDPGGCGVSCYAPTSVSSTSYVINGVVARINDTAVTFFSGGPPVQNPICISKIPNPDGIVILQEFGWSINCARVQPRCEASLSTTNSCAGYQYWQANGTFDTKTCGVNSVTAGCNSNIHNSGGNLLYCDGHVKWSALTNIHAGMFGLSPDDPYLPTNAGTYVNPGTSGYYSSLF